MQANLSMSVPVSVFLQMGKIERLNGKEDGFSLKQRAMKVLTSVSGSVCVHACVFINKLQ